MAQYGSHMPHSTGTTGAAPVPYNPYAGAMFPGLAAAGLTPAPGMSNIPTATGYPTAMPQYGWNMSATAVTQEYYAVPSGQFVTGGVPAGAPPMPTSPPPASSSGGYPPQVN